LKKIGKTTKQYLNLLSLGSDSAHEYLNDNVSTTKLVSDERDITYGKLDRVEEVGVASFRAELHVLLKITIKRTGIRTYAVIDYSIHLPHLAHKYKQIKSHFPVHGGGYNDDRNGKSKKTA
jgi:hypothetical protein